MTGFIIWNPSYVKIFFLFPPQARDLLDASEKIKSLDEDNQSDAASLAYCGAETDKLNKNSNFQIKEFQIFFIFPPQPWNLLDASEKIKSLDDQDQSNAESIANYGVETDKLNKNSNYKKS